MRLHQGLRQNQMQHSCYREAGQKNPKPPNNLNPRLSKPLEGQGTPLGARHEAAPDIPWHQPPALCGTRLSSTPGAGAAAATLSCLTPCRGGNAGDGGCPHPRKGPAELPVPDLRPNATSLLLAGKSSPACASRCCQHLSPQLGSPSTPVHRSSRRQRGPCSSERRPPRAQTPPALRAGAALPGVRGAGDEACRHRRSLFLARGARAPAGSHQRCRGLDHTRPAAPVGAEGQLSRSPASGRSPGPAGEGLCSPLHHQHLPSPFQERHQQWRRGNLCRNPVFP